MKNLHKNRTVQDRGGRASARDSGFPITSSTTAKFSELRFFDIFVSCCDRAIYGRKAKKQGRSVFVSLS